MSESLEGTLAVLETFFPGRRRGSGGMLSN